MNKIFKNRRVIFSLLAFLILLLGASLRLYRIREYLTFLGDEGRDMLVAKRIIVDHKFTLLGPITSVGSMYMGPVYYYFITPFLYLWNFDPVGPGIMVVGFSLATIFLIYLLGARFFHPAIGLIAALFYAISPLTVIYGRSSWNPNIVPFFSVVVVYALFKILIEKKYKWMIVTGLSLGVLFQLHYVTFMFIPIVFVSLYLVRFRIPKKYYLYGLVALVVAYSPFLLFEVRHQFINSAAVLRFFLEQERAAGLSIFSFWETVSDVFVRLFWRLVVVENAEFTKLFIVLSVFVIWKFWWKKITKVKFKLATQIILVWLIVGVLSYGLYQGVVYDYYLGSLFGVSFILTAIVLYTLWCKNRLGKLVALFIGIAFIFYEINHNPLIIPPSNLLKNTQTIARFIFEKAGGKPYNFALIAGRNSDHAYRYFLEVWKNPPVTIENEINDPQRKTVTDQLLIICEEKVCKPLGHPLWEIAGFGRAEIEGEWDIVTAKVFKLTHYKGQ